ncbi:hypothetical protein GGR57DRAFT_447851 [Xylariaceae sp. FL1272]|nr:hypothetical protein GGR57DRAFT_447851 [Xylariaceae sp. FL1272]
MRFTAFVAAGLVVIAANAESSTSTDVASTTTSVSPAQSSAASEITECLEKCDESDTACRAHCIAVPSPDTANVNATTSCVAACPQGDGTAADNKAYSDCVSACIGQYYFTETGTPNLSTAGPDSGSGSDSSTSTASATVTEVETTITKSGSTVVTAVASTIAPAASQTGSGKGDSDTTTSSSHGAAAVYGPASFGLFGVIAGLLL